MPGFIRCHQQHLKAIHTHPRPRQMLHQHDLRPLRYQLTRRANGFVNVSNRMAAQDLQLDKIRRDDIAGRQRIAYVEFSHPRRDDAAFFRVAHHRITKIFRCRIRRFNLTHDAENMFTLLGGAKVTAQYRITALQLIDVGNPLHDFGQMRRRHDAAGPFAVLRMVGELYGIEGPDVGAETAHRKFSGAVARMAKHNVRLNGEDVLHFLTTTLKRKRAWFPTPWFYFLFPADQAVILLTATQ